MFGTNWNAIFRKDSLIPIPIYHLVASAINNPLIQNNVHNVHPDNLEQQLKAFKKKYKILPLDELAEHFLAKKRFGNITAITFDDGYRSVILEAAPVFESLNIPFTFFINGKLLDEKVFWRDKVRALIEMNAVKEFLADAAEDWILSEPGFYKQSKDPSINSRKIETLIDQYMVKKKLSTSGETLYCDWSDVVPFNPMIQYGNHTYSHYVLSSLSDEEQHTEIARNRDLIRDKIKNESAIFSIPFGNAGTYNDQTLMILRDLGYKGYVLSGKLSACKKLEIDKFGLIRINRFMPNDEPFIKGL